jgi:DNA-binding MarR family transcriptional regulator
VLPVKSLKNCSKKISIESYQIPQNKKEIYFRLTKEGQEINDRHESLAPKIFPKGPSDLRRIN